MKRASDNEVRGSAGEVRQRQGRRPGPQPIADVVSGLLARRGYASVQQSAVVEAAWQKVTEATLGKESRTGNIRRGVLEVMVTNSVVLQELMFQKTEVLGRLIDLVPDQRIHDIRFRVGSID